MIEEDDQRGFGEQPMARFDAATDMRVAFYRFALQSYGYRCAISGLGFDPQDKNLLEKLEVVLIHPREFGGELEIGNVLVLESRIAQLFSTGVVSVAEDGTVLVAQSGELPAELEDAVKPGAELFLADDPLLWPNAKNLQFHRLTIARYGA
ncbi:hypothetical protein VW35_07875 [Devosia soli]|uniref:Uncharacterized protein n=1 Tax=Devosia soli TaxID=361041 RepID=A0A0F5LDG0_9HYPH|nr:hypothetical protein [Devosia soli]KKB80310.1 hypothetical protein VW35_07875 [Devosia soli]